MIAITRKEYGKLLSATPLQMRSREIEAIKDSAGEFISYYFYRQIWAEREISIGLPLLQKDNYPGEICYFANQQYYNKHIS